MTPQTLWICIFIGTFAAVIFFALISRAGTIIAIGGGVIVGLLALGCILYLLYRNGYSIDQWWQARKARSQAERDERARDRERRRVNEEAQRDRRRAEQEAQRERRRLEQEAQRARELERRRGVIEVEAITSPEPAHPSRW